MEITMVSVRRCIPEVKKTVPLPWHYSWNFTPIEIPTILVYWCIPEMKGIVPSISISDLSLHQFFLFDLSS
jgi:hypothetical protein